MDDIAFLITAKDPRQIRQKVSALWSGLPKILASFARAF